MFLKNRNFSSKIKRSKVTDYAALTTAASRLMVSHVNRGSNLGDHVLLNLLNELGKNDKMRGLSSILSFLCNKFIKFNDTGARILNSTFKLFCCHVFV